MNYPCAMFGDFGSSRFGFIVLTDTHTDTQNIDPRKNEDSKKIRDKKKLESLRTVVQHEH